MEINKLYEAIADNQLFHTISKQTKNNKTYLKFKRHDSVFTFIYTPSFISEQGEETPAKYVLLKDKEKARLGTLRVMWQDYLEHKQ
ncbi:MAG TPA: hypothetical protein DCS93_33860 [Microscillaceae bacterium]|nr:hypothetical protein [Microscillaceae bacterium]